MKNTKSNPSSLFLIALLSTFILLAIDNYISNRLSTNVARIASAIIFGALALPLFAKGALLSVKHKHSALVALNIICIIFIIGWTVWISLILYAFKDFQLTLPPF